ncbi:MAG: DUF1385 domain-containing protein [Clostridiales bacterium]|nr:DUF1385 domain-containing protein [Clostridiales bacterium]
MRKCNIGGQAVLEGVMMKAPDRMAIAVRKSDGEIEVISKEVKSIKDKYPVLNIPVVRGIVNFGETMVMGIRSLMDSAELYGEDGEEYKPSKFESWVSDKTGKKVEDVMVYFALLLALGFAVLLFMIGPALLTSFLGRAIKSNIGKSLVEGLIRLSAFIIYILVISRMKDIQRVFQYHGAEHKVIHCYEHEEELTVENARKFTTLHPRCGTAFLLIVMVISILAFSFLEWNNIILRILIKLLLLPLVAGVSYEIIKWAGASESKWVNIIMYPGLMLQKLTTKEPDDEQLEVAITSFFAAMGTIKEQEEAVDLEYNRSHEQSPNPIG